MYKIKDGKYEELKTTYLKGRKIYDLAENVGIKRCFMSLVLNGKRGCSKTTAYCISKAINSNLNIEDIFISVERN